MSTNSLYKTQEEILALKGLVTDTLAKKGVLGKLKAELRSNIFSVLQQGEITVENPKLTRLKSSREGRLVLDMVSEFLDYFQLDHSAQVFAAETGLNDRFDPSLRPIIVQEINLSADTSALDEPLLFCLLRQFEQRLRLKSSSALNLSKSRESLAMSPSSKDRKIVLDDQSPNSSPSKTNIDLLPRSSQTSLENISKSQPLQGLGGIQPRSLFSGSSGTLSATDPATDITVTQSFSSTKQEIPPSSLPPLIPQKVALSTSLPPLETGLKGNLSERTPNISEQMKNDVDTAAVDVDYENETFEEIPEEIPTGSIASDADLESLSPPPEFKNRNEEGLDEVVSDGTASLEDLLESSLETPANKTKDDEDDFF